MSMMSEVLANEETRGAGKRTVAGMVDSVEGLEGERFLARRRFPKRPSGRDPLRDARKRVHAGRRADARISTLDEPAEARQDWQNRATGRSQTR